MSYSRVSTEEEKQLNALEKQIRENRNIIVKQGWELIREYIDEGKSGTQIRKREGYLRLFEDLERDDFDIVVIKDQDRLMRNPKDWYLFIDRLLKNDKRLYIYLDQTFYNPDNSLITGIKAILAEEYSRHLSRKINHAHKYRQENGNSVILTNRTWGYKNTAGRIGVDEEERIVIEEIFTMYANGMGSRLICKELSSRGIRNRKGNTLAESQIRAIVRNPLYMGTAVMNKTHLNFDTKVKEKLPEEEWRYHENAVPPIVSSELWRLANENLDANSKRISGGRMEAGEKQENRKTGCKKGSALLSGKLICGECGQSFWRNKRNTGNVYWYCSEYYRNGRKENRVGCNSLRLKEDEVYGIFAELGNEVLSVQEKEELLACILNKICLLSENDALPDQRETLRITRERLVQKKEKLLELYLEGLLEKAGYRKRIDDIALELEKIVEREEVYENSKSGGTHRINELSNILNQIKGFDIAVPVMISHTSQMKVYSDRIEVYHDMGKLECPCVFTAEIWKGKRKLRQVEHKVI